jgi:hypothetical protein
MVLSSIFLAIDKPLMMTSPRPKTNENSHREHREGRTISVSHKDTQRNIKKRKALKRVGTID